MKISDILGTIGWLIAFACYAGICCAILWIITIICVAVFDPIGSLIRDTF